MKQEMFLSSEQNEEEPIGDEIMSAEAYAELEHETPYVFEVREGDKEVVYFGADHSSDAENPMFDDIRKAFEKSNPDVVLVEGIDGLKERKEQALARLKEEDEEKIIAEMGESGFALKLAVENGADIASPEPSRRDEVEYLMEQGFSKEDIFAYYVFRLLPQWHRQTEKQDIEDYLAPHIAELKGATQWEDFDYSYDNANSIAKNIWGEDINIEDPEYYHDRTDPIPWKDKKEEQTAINEVARATSFFRDKHVVENIDRQLDMHDKVFVVFGASHAVMQEPALRTLLR